MRICKEPKEISRTLMRDKGEVFCSNYSCETKADLLVLIVRKNIQSLVISFISLVFFSSMSL
jgi:hypothetical protein